MGHLILLLARMHPQWSVRSAGTLRGAQCNRSFSASGNGRSSSTGVFGGKPVESQVRAKVGNRCVIQYPDTC